MYEFPKVILHLDKNYLKQLIFIANLSEDYLQ